MVHTLGIYPISFTCVQYVAVLQCVFTYLCVEMGTTGCVFQPSVLSKQYMCMIAQNIFCPHVLKQASALIQSPEHSITLCTISPQPQKGIRDCGLFTQTLCFGLVPCHNKMEPRHHAKTPLELF